MSSSNRRPLVALAFSLVIFGVLGLNSAGGVLDWGRFWTKYNNVAMIVHYQILPILLLAGTLISWKRVPRLAIAIAAVALLNGAAIVWRSFVERTAYLEHPPVFFSVAGSISVAGGVLGMTLLLVQRLRGRAEHVRIVGIVLFAVVFFLYLAALAFPRLLSHAWVACGRAVISTVSAFVVAFLAWCLAFRQEAAPHRPPVDAGKSVSLACPRCAAPITVPSGHGECPHCRLQISIALDEGACEKCRYPLRGLTGDKCPECGEAIVKAAANPA